ncbi:hypothetical protein CRE_00479 [Caenorhabditis remanei]|uniref:Uncharacterized protein n=2 Tax=Caenorhabditis remanei TaxID=31234 RepID=E3LC87_CAERE|nr:hypothetical protein CRE_00479 [Caenorhabditis remanei]
MFKATINDWLIRLKLKSAHVIFDNEEEENIGKPRGPIGHPDYWDKALCEEGKGGRAGFTLVKVGSKEWNKEMKKIELKAEFHFYTDAYKKKDLDQDWLHDGKKVCEAEILILLRNQPGTFLVTRRRGVGSEYMLHSCGENGRVYVRKIATGPHKNRWCYTVTEAIVYSVSISGLIDYLKEKEIKLNGAVLDKHVVRTPCYECKEIFCQCPST